MAQKENRLGMIRLALLGLMMLSLAACSSLGGEVSSGFGLLSSSNKGPQPAPLVNFTPRVALHLVWSRHIADGGGYVFSPWIDAGSVYVAGHDGTIARLNLTDGKTQWQVNAGQKLTGGVGTGAGRVVVGTGKGAVLAFDENSGKPVWHALASSEVLSAPRISHGLVVVRTEDNRITAYDALTGKIKWFYEHATPPLTIWNHAGILIERSAVFAGYGGGKLAAVDLINGNLGWEASVAIPHGATEIERIADITSNPVMDRRHVYAVAYHGRVVSLDARSGNIVWARKMSSIAGLAVDDHNVYISEANGDVIALDKNTGERVWTQRGLLARHLSTPAVVGAYVAVGDFQGYLHLLSRQDGAFAGRIATDGSAIITRPIPLTGGVLVQTHDGGIYTFRLKPDTRPSS